MSLNSELCLQGLTCHPDVLQLGHQLAVEAAHGVPREEAHALGLQVAVDPGELGYEGLLALLVLLSQHQLELAVHILDDACHLFVLSQIHISTNC